MIVDKQISWFDKVSNQKEMKENGFVSANKIVSKEFIEEYHYVSLNELRSEAKNTNNIFCIRVNISGTNSYWYKESDVIKYISSKRVNLWIDII